MRSCTTRAQHADGGDDDHMIMILVHLSYLHLCSPSSLYLHALLRGDAC